jgi:hypothetical protein
VRKLQRPDAITKIISVFPRRSRESLHEWTYRVVDELEEFMFVFARALTCGAQKRERRVSTPLAVTNCSVQPYRPGVVDVPVEDPEFVELLPEVEPVEFTLPLVLLSFLSFLDFLLFLSVLVELMLRSLLLELEFVLLLGELTPGLVELPAVPDDPAVWPIANGLRLIERAGTSKKASLFFILLAPLERRFY